MDIKSTMQASSPFHSSTLVTVLDACISVMGTLFAILFVRWQIHTMPGFQYYVINLVICAIAATVLAWLIVKPYRIVVRYASLKSSGKLMAATAIKEVVMFLVLLTGMVKFDKGMDFDIMYIAIDFSITAILLILFRIIVLMIIDDMGNDYALKVGLMNVMIYGTSDKAIATAVRLGQSHHYNVLGFISMNKEDGGRILRDDKVYYCSGTQESLREFKVNFGMEGILFPRQEDIEAEKAGIVPAALEAGIHLLTTPRIEDLTGQQEFRSKASAKDNPDDNFIPDGMTAFERHLKRVVDLCLSTILIIFFSPLILICAIAVKIGGGPGPVLFKQERIGRFGRPFNIYKFRSMRSDAESAGPALYSGDDDPRLTKVGRFLRVHHLDELPQLFNVFLGQMAFIGYRPERKFYIDQIMERDPRYYYLYQIRPGVTSYATLKNGYTDSMEKMLKRLEYDLYYLRNRSIWFDIKILAQTFLSIVFGKKF